MVLLIEMILMIARGGRDAACAGHREVESRTITIAEMFRFEAVELYDSRLIRVRNSAAEH
ncbi:hypothetical protein ASF32_19790 [Methylobacterium sp. Leaf91]|nr:hypothetical protein ASF32_19790 [Methylobacterium sp. Leaf91]